MKNIFFILLIFLSSLMAKDDFNADDFLHKVEKLVITPIYDMETKNIDKLLNNIIIKNKQVKSIIIRESIEDETIFSCYKNGLEYVFNQGVPKKYLRNKTKDYTILFKNEKLAKITINYSEPQNIGLTKEELNWIDTNILNVGIDSNKPLLFIKNGLLDGIGGDFLQQVVNLTGLEIHLVQDKRKRLIDMFKASNINLLPAEYYSESKLNYGIYSEPYFSINHQKVSFLIDIKDDILISILNKALKHIDKKELIKIKSKYLIKAKVDERIELKITDLLPMKEIGIILFILFLVIVFMFKYLNKKDNVYFGTFVSIFVSIFLLIAIIITIISIKNVESTQKNKIKNSLQTVLNMTNTCLTEWINIQVELNTYLVNNSPYLNDIKKLVVHQDNIEYIKSNQNLVFKYNKNIKKNFKNKESFFLVTKDYKVLSSSKWSMIGTYLDNKKLKIFIDKAFENGYAIFTPYKTKNDFFHKIYLLNVIYDKTTNKPMAVYATDLDIDSLNKITKKGRIGDGSETYIINSYAEFISQSRFKDDSFLELEAKNNDILTKPAESILSKKSLSDIKGYKNYMNKEVFGSWSYNKDLDIVVITEINKIKAMQSFKELKAVVYITVFTIAGFTIILMAFIVWFSNKNRKIVEQKNEELEHMIEDFDKNIIASHTDLAGRITYVSKAFCEVCQYDKEELIGKTHNVVRHPDMQKELFDDVWQTIKSDKIWRGEIKNIKKDGSYYWIEAIISPEYDMQGTKIGYSAIRQDITAKKVVEELTKNQEIIIKQRTKELESEKKLINSIVNSQDSMVVTSDGKQLMTVNILPQKNQTTFQESLFLKW